jgi:hypothetical protein
MLSKFETQLNHQVSQGTFGTTPFANIFLGDNPAVFVFPRMRTVASPNFDDPEILDLFGGVANTLGYLYTVMLWLDVVGLYLLVRLVLWPSLKRCCSVSCKAYSRNKGHKVANQPGQANAKSVPQVRTRTANFIGDGECAA